MGDWDLKFKSEFQLTFDIKTNSDNMEEILKIITENIGREITERIKNKTEVECTSEIKRIDADLWVFKITTRILSSW